jgi:hypothetical protein
MGKRQRQKQTSMWVATHDLPRSAAHPFYTRLNQILDRHDFDGATSKDSASDSTRTKAGLGCLIDLGAHEAVFTWLLQRLADAGLVKGKTVGIDATTLEANAALRSIVRRDSGESYQDFLTKLAQASGIETLHRLNGTQSRDA